MGHGTGTDVGRATVRSFRSDCASRNPAKIRGSILYFGQIFVPIQADRHANLGLRPTWIRPADNLQLISSAFRIRRTLPRHRTRIFSPRVISEGIPR